MYPLKCVYTLTSDADLSDLPPPFEYLSPLYGYIPSLQGAHSRTSPAAVCTPRSLCILSPDTCLAVVCTCQLTYIQDS